MNKIMSCWVIVYATLSCATGAFSQNIPFDSNRWQIEAVESRVEEFMGQQSLYLKGGLACIHDDDFLDGVIEFDVSTAGERGFMGGIWRMKDPSELRGFLYPAPPGRKSRRQPIHAGVPRARSISTAV